MSRDETPDTTGLLTCKACGVTHDGNHAHPTPDASHVVHVTAEPVAEDVVWCEQCEEWVTAGAPEATPDASPDPVPHHQSGDECDPWCPPTFPHHTSDPAVVTPDAGVDTALIVSSLMAGRVSGPEAVAALDAQIANHVAAAREADRAEVERLRHWKDEALPVIDGLQELGKALDMPLGARITGPDALVAVQRLTERAEAAEEQLAGLVAKIEALPSLLRRHDDVPDGKNRYTTDLQNALFNVWAEADENVGDYEIGERLAEAAVRTIEQALRALIAADAATALDGSES